MSKLEAKLTWSDVWCILNPTKLKQHEGSWIAVHSAFGVLSSARTEADLRDRVKETIKKKLLPNVAFIDVDVALLQFAPKAPPPKQELPPLDRIDPFENEVKRGFLSIQAYAKERGVSSTSVLIKLIDFEVPHAHINMDLSILDEAKWVKLNEAFPVPAPTENPFPSPHKQPAFKPSSTGAHDRDAMIDGAGQAWRMRKMTVD